MRKFVFLITAFVLFCTLLLAKKISLTASSIVPAAQGIVDIGKDRNGNTELKVQVEHLARPDNLTPSESVYIVWFQDHESPAENQGELKVNNKLQGTFQTVTPHKTFDLFVTAEQDKTVKAPAGPEVLRARIER